MRSARSTRAAWNAGRTCRRASRQTNDFKNNAHRSSAGSRACSAASRRRVELFSVSL